MNSSKLANPLQTVLNFKVVQCRPNGDKMIARGGTVVIYPHSELNQTEELKEIHG